MDVYNLVARLTLDSSEYEKALDRIKQGLPNVSAAFSNTGNVINNVSMSVEELTNRMGSTQKTFDNASALVTKLVEAYNNSAAATGSTSEETLRLMKELDEARATMSSAENELIGLTAAYDKLTKGESAVGENAKSAEKELDSFKQSENEVEEQSNKTAESANKLGSALGGAFKAVGVAVGAALSAAAAGATALVKQSTDAFANYQQLVGGVETLFSNLEGTVSAAPKVLENASNAYKTAGMSANQYMETVTSFSAALVASLDNDYNKAAEVSDMAIRDMSDNANKMGTSLESIQNAYQGFAKQNYTINLMSAA